MFGILTQLSKYLAIKFLLYIVSFWAVIEVCGYATPDEAMHTLEHTRYLSDSSLAAVEEVLEPCETDSSSASSSLLCFRGEMAASASLFVCR